MACNYANHFYNQYKNYGLIITFSAGGGGGLLALALTTQDESVSDNNTIATAGFINFSNAFIILFSFIINDSNKIMP